MVSKDVSKQPDTAALLVMVALLGVGCASAPSGPTTAPAAPAPAPVAAAPAPAPPAPLTEAQIREDKALAQRLALEAVDQLQNGDELTARATLERALSLDPGSQLGRNLMDQIRADPQKELGAMSFRYTVQPDDTLSKLAARFLGDRYRFYILARYNDITNPNRLPVGAVIRIPGAAPPPGTLATTKPATRPETVDTAARPPGLAETKPTSEAERIYRAGIAQRNAGNLDAAYASFSDAARREPGNADYVKQADLARRDLVRRYDRDATQAFQRQNLDLAIKNWDQVLELDPDNQKAKLERSRAIDLRKRLQDKFGSK